MWAVQEALPLPTASAAPPTEPALAHSELLLVGLTPSISPAEAELGWVAPASGEDDRAEIPANWTLPLIRGDWPYLIEMLLATMVSVRGFNSHLPIEVRSFGCNQPCRDCSWPDELLEEAP